MSEENGDNKPPVEGDLVWLTTQEWANLIAFVGKSRTDLANDLVRDNMNMLSLIGQRAAGGEWAATLSKRGDPDGS